MFLAPESHRVSSSLQEQVADKFRFVEGLATLHAVRLAGKHVPDSGSSQAELRNTPMDTICDINWIEPAWAEP